MNKEFISVLTYLTAFVLFLTKTVVVEVIMVDTNKIIKVPDLDFCKVPPVHWDLDVDDIKPWQKLGGLF